MTFSKHRHLETKIIYPGQDSGIEKQITYYRFKDKRIVFTNGCFDIFHAGHVDYLARAADLGDILIVGLNTDTSVSRIKGEGRPLNDQRARAMVLAALSFVDLIILFEEDTPEKLVALISPDVLVKGDDYRDRYIAGAEHVISEGGRVITLSLLEGFSTSEIMRRIQQETTLPFKKK